MSIGGFLWQLRATPPEDPAAQAPDRGLDPPLPTARNRPSTAALRSPKLPCRTAGRAYVKLSAAYRISTRGLTPLTSSRSRRRSSQPIRSASSGEVIGPIPMRSPGPGEPDESPRDDCFGVVLSHSQTTEFGHKRAIRAAAVAVSIIMGCMHVDATRSGIS